MRTSWLKTFAILSCIAGLAASPALANPASMAVHGQPTASKTKTIWPWSKDKPAAAPTVAPLGPAPRPTESISAKQHPIKYLKAAVSEMPFSSKGKVAQRHAVPPAQPQVSAALSLNTPTGPPSPEFFIYAAQVCEKQGDLPQARENFQRALNMWPGQVEVLRAAARMEDRQGNLPLAENLYQQAVTCNPQHVAALNDLGLCLARQGKLEPSAQVLEQAVQLHPAKALYRNNAATVLVEMRQDQRALAHLAPVHGPAEANYNLGQLLVERGRSADATPFFQAALQQNPNLHQAMDALAKLQGTQIVAATPATSTPGVATPATTPTATTPAATTVAAQPAAPTAAPQQTAVAGPTTYPTTAAVTPAVDAANYVPTAAPQYLPPVAARPEAGAVRR